MSSLALSAVRSIVALGLLLTAALVRADAPTAADFASRPEYSRLRLSPDGSSIGVIAEINGQQGLMVIRLADKAGLFRDPEQAAARMKAVLAVRGVAT